MTEDQKKIIDGANDKMRPALELYERRRELFILACKVPGSELARTCRALQALTPDEVMELLAYAEGLAAWRATAQESGDAPISQPRAEATNPTGGWVGGPSTGPSSRRVG